MVVLIRFENGSEDRWSDTLGPYDYIQMTYDELNASPDGDVRLATRDPDGYWYTEDGLAWSDFVIFGDKDA